MAEFEVLVREIEHEVENHPNADRLSLIRIDDFICISAKLENGEHRYKKGDLLVYVPEGAIVPENLLKRGFWDETKNKGILAGSKGNRVKAIKLRDIVSQGIVFPVIDGEVEGIKIPTKINENVADILGITKYVPEIPIGMAGEVLNLFGIPDKYDFESIQKITDMFDSNMLVVATEKLHGSCMQFGLIPSLHNEELFGENKNIYVCSKGLGAQGLVFKNNEANNNNIYVRILRGLLENDLEYKMKNLVNDEPHAEIRIFGEVFGKGIQDLGYGLDKPHFRLFDIKIGNTWVSHGAGSLKFFADKLGIETVPELYTGPYDTDILKDYRDGKDTISGTHVREGIVIRAFDESNRHPIHGRRIAKWVSPNYLLRKGETTEYQ